jgi:hypothetical protein
MVNQPSAARRRVGEYHGPPETINVRAGFQGKGLPMATGWLQSLRRGAAALRASVLLAPATSSVDGLAGAATKPCPSVLPRRFLVGAARRSTLHVVPTG